MNFSPATIIVRKCVFLGLEQTKQNYCDSFLQLAVVERWITLQVFLLRVTNTDWRSTGTKS